MKFKISSVAAHETNHVQVTAAGIPPAEGAPREFSGPAGNSLVILHLTTEAGKAFKEGDILEVSRVTG